MDGKTVSNEEKYFEIFEKLKSFGFRKDIQVRTHRTIQTADHRPYFDGRVR